ncbi:hypothetical protein B6N60_02407 [Richelia sinica FACHB-800]|uniref:Uncharacterized protein n=1 Tax=Richelia sinica FACHB-800 TaxID=1357546 RepID=A0A975T930_9NOST|nr:hypothetical protein [Richelia sinica]MBD2665221.1 hypothetical protein [Richelia sinica FACHB-800]QXE23717.1 hypothetical protein B6N60_02407 [Richelia sinica FACHB-800]
MTPSILRQLWSIVEAAQTVTLLQLDDASLVQWLVKQTAKQILLDANETDYLYDYIRARLNLIRELAYERQHSYN